MIGGNTLVITRDGIQRVRDIAGKVVYLSEGHRWAPIVFEPAGVNPTVYRSIQSLGFYADLTLDECVLDCNARAIDLGYFEVASTHRSTVKSYRLVHRQFVPSPDYGDLYPPEYFNLSKYDQQKPVIEFPLSTPKYVLQSQILEASKLPYDRRYWECSYILCHYAKLMVSNRCSALFYLPMPNITTARMMQLLFASCNLVTKVRSTPSTLAREIKDSYTSFGDFSKYRFPSVTLRIMEGKYLHITDEFIKDFFDRNMHKSYTITETRHYREFYSQPLAKRLKLRLRASEGYRNHSYCYLINPPSREAMPTVSYQEPLEYDCDVYSLRHAENKKIISVLVGGYFITERRPRYRGDKVLRDCNSDV